ncbi:putative L-ascorbate peroxidase 6 isoform X2 [Andrographis paniculata]|uniref:putative L-ascorbate peroxidase 6 isoform X2 n=1 Tax=Andrographis paniculata TaxID=175694 RepID=UPI0021E6EF19|nr:putative L-ascorbate peroxidase 6 isoform X2 [Andrographis paniculata]
MRSATSAWDPSSLLVPGRAPFFFKADAAPNRRVRDYPPPNLQGGRRHSVIICASPAPVPSPSPSPLLGRRALVSIATASFLVPFSSLASATDENSLLREEIRKVLSKGKAPGFLRLVFHDAGTFDMDDKTGGMNGSIVYELERPENMGLDKSLKVLEKAKGQTDTVNPVSWADLIAVAGAEAVEICGGPKIPVQLGRIDAKVPDPDGRLPQESLDASTMKQFFKKKGFSIQELVALSGAHTLGGMSGMIGLPSDRALAEDSECIRWITKYANDEGLFFKDFAEAYVKLVNTGAIWMEI